MMNAVTFQCVECQTEIRSSKVDRFVQATRPDTLQIQFSSIIYLYSHYQTCEVFIINKSGESTIYVKLADM